LPPIRKRKIIIMPISRKRQRTSNGSSSTSSRYAPRKMRLYRAPRMGTPGVYKFKRQIQVSMTVNQSTGFFGAGYDLGIYPSLNQCDIRINGVLVFSPTLPNVTEFTNLFDMYKIVKVGVRAMFSGNSSEPASPTLCLPVVHQMNDYNSQGAMTIADYGEHPELKTWQLGQDRNISWSFQPRVRGDLLTIGGVLSSSADNKACPWIDTSTSTIQMLGTRFFLNNLGRNTNQDIGNILFLIDYYMEFKFVR